MLERFYQWICVCCTFNLEFVFTCIRLQLRAFFFLAGRPVSSTVIESPASGAVDPGQALGRVTPETLKR